MILTIPIKCVSYNQLLRKNHWKVSALANSFKEATLEAIQKAKFAPVSHSSYPVAISFHASWKQARRHDIDSLYAAKPIIDQLVTSKILVDDSLKYVKSVTYTGEIGAERDEIRIKIG